MCCIHRSIGHIYGHANVGWDMDYGDIALPFLPYCVFLGMGTSCFLESYPAGMCSTIARNVGTKISMDKTTN